MGRQAHTNDLKSPEKPILRNVYYSEGQMVFQGKWRSDFHGNLFKGGET